MGDASLACNTVFFFFLKKGFGIIASISKPTSGETVAGKIRRKQI